MRNIYIEIQEVVANALIELLKKDENRRTVYFKELDAYGAKVIEKLNENNEINAFFIVSRESQQAIVDDFSDIFELVIDDGAKGIKLKDGITPDDLWQKFCSSLAWIVIAAFRSNEACNALGI